MIRLQRECGREDRGLSRIVVEPRVRSRKSEVGSCKGVEGSGIGGGESGRISRMVEER